MKRIKLLSIILIIILLCKANIYPLYSNANEKDTGNKIVKINIVLGCYYIRKHNDGHWQYGVEKGEHVNFNTEATYPYAEGKDTAKLLSVTFFQGEGSTIDEDRVLWNRWREPLYHEDFDDDWMGEDGYRKSSVKSATYKIDEEKPNGNGKATINIDTDLIAKIIPVWCKKDWQGENVEGWKFYIPRIEVWEIEGDNNIDITSNITAPTTAEKADYIKFYLLSFFMAKN
jgi:hypothetical protein